MVQIRLIGVVQHVHHVCAADARRIVQARVVVTASFQFAHALCRQRFHILFGAKVDSSGWAGFHAGRFLSHRHTVDAQRTFVDAVVFRVQARHVERAAGDAVAAADALLGLEVYDTVGPWQSRAWQSIDTIPSARVNLPSRIPVSLLAAEEHSMLVEVQRLTVSVTIQFTAWGHSAGN